MPRRSSAIALALLALCLATLACQAPGPASPPVDPYSTALITASPQPAADWYGVYFSDPLGPAAKTLRGGPDRRLSQAIEAARLSVDIAVLDLDLWTIRDALIAAHRRGVPVRMVVESDYLDEPEIQEIEAAGVPILGDRREGLMHDKFVVIDRREVWTGSLNPTINDAYRNNNNLVRIDSPDLAEDYTTEFEEMFSADRFGPGSPANTPYPSLTIGGAEVEVYFSPDDGAQARLVELIHGARNSISFLAYSFTADELADALVERFRAGVTVEGVMEVSQIESNSGTDFERMLQAGIDVRRDGNPRNMHHKVIIIDGQVVVTGSYNFSYNAETKNDENTLIVHDASFAGLFLEEFGRVYEQADH